MDVVFCRRGGGYPFSYIHLSANSQRSCGSEHTAVAWKRVCVYVSPSREFGGIRIETTTPGMLRVSHEPIPGAATADEPRRLALPCTGDQWGQPKLRGLRGSYSYIVNTSSSNPCSENNQIFRLSNCFSCLVTSSPTMSAFENASGLPSAPLHVCVFFPLVGHSFLSPQNQHASCCALELLNTFI